MGEIYSHIKPTKRPEWKKEFREKEKFSFSPGELEESFPLFIMSPYFSYPDVGFVHKFMVFV